MVSSLTSVGHFFFPPAEDPTECKGEEKEQTLKDRITKNWREIPALVAVAVCIIGLIVSIGWNYTHLSIAFGVGSGCSTYTYFYVSSQVHNLKSMKGYLGDFQEENVQLSATTTALHTEAETFQAENLALQSETAAFKAENLTLTSTVNQLKLLNTALHSFYETFSTEGAKSQEEFKEKLELFDTDLKALGEEHTSAHVTAELLSKTLSSFSQSVQFDQLQQLFQANLSAAQQLGQNQQELANFKKTIDDIKPVVETLLTSLQTETGRMALNADKVDGTADTLQKALEQVNTLAQQFLGGSQTYFQVQGGHEVAVYT